MIGYAPFLGQVRLALPSIGQLPRYQPPRITRAEPRVALAQATDSDGPSASALILGLVGIASVGLSAYHGYKRNNSTGWAIWWGLMGALFPVITPAIAIAQGLGKRAKK